MAKTGIPEAIEALEKANLSLALAWAEAKAANDVEAMVNLARERQHFLEMAKTLREMERYLVQPKLAKFFKEQV